MGVAGQDEVIQPNPEDPPVDDVVVDPPQGDDTSDPPEGGEDEEEDVVQIGEEEPPASEEQQAAPAWVKDLRRENREKAKRIAELERQVGTGQPMQAQVPQLPEKPKLADHDFDEEKYQAAMDGWYAKKRDVEAHEASQRDAVAAQQKVIQAVHENYATSKKQLRVKDFQDAEEEVTSKFSKVQQSIVIAGATNPGAIVYALGKNPKKLQELASIKDPVKFAVAVGKLETEVKVTKRTSTKPAPEAPLRSTSSAPASTATLERLEAEAAKTGDRSKVVAYKRQQRAKG